MINKAKYSYTYVIGGNNNGALVVKSITSKGERISDLVKFVGAVLSLSGGIDLANDDRSNVW